MSDNGWIKLHRKILNWEWYQDSKTLHLFIHLLVNANHQAKKWRGIIIERGQVLTGRHKLKELTGISEQSIRTSLERLKSTSEITIKTTNRFSIITLCNYENYQNIEFDINQQNNQQSNKPVTSNQPATNHKQECKELKNDKNNKEIYTEIISHLNLILGTKYKPNAKDTIARINARLKDGFTVEDFKTVIEKKFIEWGSDSKMATFLRPETLFGTKFEAYLNQVMVKPKPKTALGIAMQTWEDEANDDSGSGQIINIPCDSISKL